ncbi:MAG: hypothetical protein KBC56_08705, partial [Flavobacterium sp.]|nr:hypothetical protein [Flavobacterium sp.]
PIRSFLSECFSGVGGVEYVERYFSYGNITNFIFTVQIFTKIYKSPPINLFQQFSMLIIQLLVITAFCQQIIHLTLYFL